MLFEMGALEKSRAQIVALFGVKPITRITVDRWSLSGFASSAIENATVNFEENMATSRGSIYTIRQIREALQARHADLKEDGSIRFTGSHPQVFMGIVADDNEAIVTEDCFYYVDGEPRRLIDALPGDP